MLLIPIRIPSLPPRQAEPYFGEMISRRARYLSTNLRSLSAKRRLSRIFSDFDAGTVVTTSFGPTSAVLLHMASDLCPGIRVVNVRHGHETEATLRFADACQSRFHINLHVYQAPFLSIPSWGSTEFEEYCRVVKVETMAMALRQEDAKTWISGLFHDETRERRRLRLAEVRLNAVAVYPLLDWCMHEAVKYCEFYNLEFNNDYFDPCKGPHQKLECGLHIDIGPAADKGSCENG